MACPAGSSFRVAHEVAGACVRAAESRGSVSTISTTRCSRVMIGTHRSRDVLTVRQVISLAMLRAERHPSQVRRQLAVISEALPGLRDRWPAGARR